MVKGGGGGWGQNLKKKKFCYFFLIIVLSFKNNDLKQKFVIGVKGRGSGTKKNKFINLKNITSPYIIEQKP